MVLGRLADAELGEDLRDVLLDRVGRDDEHLGDAAVRAALGHQLEHVALAPSELVERVVAPPPAEHARDDGRVQRRAPGAHAADGVGEHREVGHAVLEQVADSLGAVADEVERVALFRELRQHEHANFGLARADLERCAEPVVGVVRRHLHVHDRDVGLVRAHLAQQVGRIAGLGDDLEPGVPEQPHDALAQQRLVLADDDPHTPILSPRQDVGVAGSSPNPYVFLVGSARSGTTLLRRIVDAHPLIAISPETHWVPRFYDRRIGVTDAGTVTDELVPQLVGYRRFGRFGVSEEAVAQLAGGDAPVSYAAFASGFYDLIGEARGKRLVGDKTGEYSRALPTLHALWPATRFVHLIRDGRDVALSVLSWKENPGASRLSTWKDDAVMTTALWWSRNVQLARDARSTLPSRLYHELRYEALVAQPEAQCAALCAFLDLPYDEAMLRFHEGRTRHEPGLSAKHAWLPITPNLRNWRKQMPADEIERFEAVAGELLDELGYERAFPRPQPGLLRRAAELRDRVGADLRAQRQPVPAAW